MDWLFSAMISRGSLLQLHIWGRRPTHQFLPLVVDNSLVCQEEWKRTCLLSLPGQASGGTNYMYKYSSCRAVTWSAMHLGQLHSACLLTDTPAAGGCVSSALLWKHLLDEGHWSQRLTVKIHLWQWKYVLILRRFSSYLGLCASSVFCLMIVSRVFVKGNQKGEENYNAQIFRKWWYKE